jgi:hypothetical protein
VELSATRSFEITDKPIVTSFTLTRLLTQLIGRSGVNGLTADQLIRRMFDTQTPRVGSLDPDGSLCDDTLTNGAPSFNGFPHRCPTPEGKLAAVQNLAGQFFTLGLMNRFDQAPPDGSNCGQYRMVFAHKDSETSASTLVRRHLIFEAVLPNPNPVLGLSACRPVAKFWSDLSAVDSMDERRERLDKFFFEGLDGFAPVVDAANFADPGGIRSFVMSADGVTNISIRFYQFRMAKQCGFCFRAPASYPGSNRFSLFRWVGRANGRYCGSGIGFPARARLATSRLHREVVSRRPSVSSSSNLRTWLANSDLAGRQGLLG